MRRATPQSCRMMRWQRVAVVCHDCVGGLPRRCSNYFSWSGGIQPAFCLGHPLRHHPILAAMLAAPLKLVLASLLSRTNTVNNNTDNHITSNRRRTMNKRTHPRRQNKGCAPPRTDNAATHTVVSYWGLHGCRTGIDARCCVVLRGRCGCHLWARAGLTSSSSASSTSSVASLVQAVFAQVRSHLS